MDQSIYPIIEQVGVIGKNFPKNIEIYLHQEIKLTLFVNPNNLLHKKFMEYIMGVNNFSLNRNIKIVYKENSQLENSFIGSISLNLNDHNKVIKLINITISR